MVSKSNLQLCISYHFHLFKYCHKSNGKVHRKHLASSSAVQPFKVTSIHLQLPKSGEFTAAMVLLVGTTGCRSRHQMPGNFGKDFEV